MEGNLELQRSIRNIGFYDSMKSGTQTVHVETEVTIDDRIVITTKTWVSGSVKDKVVQFSDLPDQDILNNLKAIAEVQHLRAREKAEQEI